jgi:hypothetical protein
MSIAKNILTDRFIDLPPVWDFRLIIANRSGGIATVAEMWQTYE